MVPNASATRTSLQTSPSGKLSDSPAGRSAAVSLAGLLGPGIGELATCPVADALASADEGSIPAHGHLVLPDMVIATGDTGALIEFDEDRPVLTGTRGMRNDCRLLFRHAYGTVRCEVEARGAEAHLGFLVWRGGAFEEVQTIDLQRRLARGYRDDNGGELSTVVQFHAEPLREVHGIVWRGGLLRIANLSLRP
jgi:hypothetical protein